MGKYAIFDLLSQACASWAFFVVFSILVLVFGGIFPIGIAAVLALGIGVAERKFWNKRLEAAPKGSAVVVTGCSSGFGFSLATRLADSGVLVFAGVRKESDGVKVKDGSKIPGNIYPIILDVTKATQIEDAVAEVEETLTSSDAKLLALVNNAGYGEYGPVECIPIDSMRSQMEVNVFGLVAVTQKFLPLLRNRGTKGPLAARVINISSGAGRISLPAAGTYSASKYAIEALSDALRAELQPWKIPVVLVEPGRFHTEFQNKAYSENNIANVDVMDERVKAHYVARMEEVNEHSAQRKRPHMDHCVKVIEDAILDTRPLPRYLAGTDVQYGIPLASIFPEVFKDYLLSGNWKRKSA